jgi:hypothetical protein
LCEQLFKNSDRLAQFGIAICGSHRVSRIALLVAGGNEHSSLLKLKVQRIHALDAGVSLVDAKSSSTSASNVLQVARTWLTL